MKSSKQEFKQIAKNFKVAAKSLYRDLEKNNYLEYGLCHALRYNNRATLEYSDYSYDVMNSVLTDEEYFKGLGLNGEYNEDRKVFLELLAYTLTLEDLVDFISNSNLFMDVQ